MNHPGPRLGGNLPVILQAERSECALACLAMVLGFFGYRIDQNTLRKRCQISQHGVTLKALLGMATGLHLAVRPLRVSLPDCRQLALPAILHWDLDHFVVLKKTSRGHMTIHDPATGSRKVTWTEADRHFTGVALECWPAEGFQKADVRQYLSLREVWRHAHGLGQGIVQILLLSALLQFIALGMPFYTQVLLDDVLLSRDIELLKLLAVGFLMLVIFRQATEWLRGRIIMYLGNRVSFQFATRLCRHLLHLPLDYFSRRHIGDLVSRFNSLNQVRDFICSGIVEVIIDGVMVVGTLTMMYFYSKPLTLLALSAVVIYGLLRLASYGFLYTRNEEMIHDRAIESTCFMENINAIQGIKMYGREHARLAAWQNTYANAIHSAVTVQKLGLDLQCFHGLLVGAENVLIFLAGAFAVMNGELTIGMLLAFVSFKDHFYRNTFSLLDNLFEFRLLGLHLSRLADIALNDTEGLGQPPVAVNHVIGTLSPMDISVSGLAYGYETDKSPLFSNVSLELCKSETVAIIGPTGCGKSSFLKIMAGLVKPLEGDLLCNGFRINSYNLAAYRNGISGVMQNDTLLSGSILENITFFDPTPDLDRVRDVAAKAMIDVDIARMPMQFNTMVGNMGSALSGGQVQRILLARALYKQPGFLILDEATSHLDLETERGVNTMLRDLDIPCLIAAHRPQAVLQADRILFLSQEGLVSISHEQFMEQVGQPLPVIS